MKNTSDANNTKTQVSTNEGSEGNKGGGESVIDMKNAEKLYTNIQGKTNELKDYNDKLEKEIAELERGAKITVDTNKKSELSESIQIAEENKELDDIEKDFDAALIDIYADVASASEDDNQ